MKKLLAIATLGIAISFPSLSVADIQPFGVETPIESASVENKIDGGYTVNNYMDFYLNPMVENTEYLLSTIHETGEKESYVVFGVKIPAKSGS